MQAVVLAAGRDTRLGHLTAHRSKAMLPVLGRPLVGRVLEGLWAAGLRRFVVVGAAEDRALSADVQVALPADVKLVPPVRVEAGVEVAGGASSLLGPRVYLESGCRIGTGVMRRDAVVLRGSAVPDGARVMRKIWSGDQKS